MSPARPPWRTCESLGELSHPYLGDDSMLGKERVQLDTCCAHQGSGRSSGAGGGSSADGQTRGPTKVGVRVPEPEGPGRTAPDQWK